MKITTVEIDLAKNVFVVHGVDDARQSGAAQVVEAGRNGEVLREA